MNRKLIVTLLHKNIEELGMITDSFMEMEEYPTAIVHIAKRKAEDIQLLLEQLAGIRTETPSVHTETTETEIPTKVEKIIEPETLPEIIIPPVETKAAEPVVVEDSYTIVSEELYAVEEPQIASKEEEIPEVMAEIVEEVSIIETPVTQTDDARQESEVRMTIETKTTREVSEITTEHERKISTEEIHKTTLADKITSPTLSRNEAHSKINDNSLSAVIANKKITDIKTAISIGDRFRFQRELFRGNGEEMNKTLSYVNQLATLEEVISFLQSKYGWEEENEIAEDFYQIVRRKFL